MKEIDFLYLCTIGRNYLLTNTFKLLIILQLIIILFVNYVSYILAMCNFSDAIKIYDETEIADIVQIFEDMNGEEFENSSSELKHIYITYGLEERRNKYYEKIGYIHIELLFLKI